MSIYEIDRDSDTPLYLQIHNNIENAIIEGELKPGDKLPAVATLAKEIGVTQATVRRALKDLSSAGRTSCHVGRGTFIVDDDDDLKQADSSISNDRFPDYKGVSARNPREFAARRLRMGVSKALSDIMSLKHRPGIIHLTNGIPDPGLLPENLFSELVMETLGKGSAQYVEAAPPAGLLELRGEIANRFSTEKMTICADQVLITNGSLQAATLVAEAALEKKRNVIFETPCFKGMIDTFAAMGHWVETVPRDHDGPIIEKLENFSSPGSSLLYLCPYAHNPMGTNLSNSRYDELVSWAKKSGSVVIADEIFKDMEYEQSLQPTLMEALGDGQTIVLSSLSKSVMTGLRVGWVISSKERIRRIAQFKRLMDHSCPTFMQGMALSLFQSGRFDDHTKQMRALYKKRMDTMLRSLEKLMPKGVTWSKPDGGFSLLVELPMGYSSVALFLSAIEKGVSFLPGPLFDIDQRYVNTFRLSTAWADAHQIKEGVELLGDAVDEFISRPPGDTGLSGLGSYQ